MTTFDLVGHSYAVPLGVTTSKGAMQLLAAHLGAELTNHAVSGAILYSSKASGGYATVANALARDSDTYARGADCGGVWYGGNDLYAMDSTFSAASQDHLKADVRFAISRMCAGKIFDDEDTSITYTGFTKSVEEGEKKVTGKFTHYATTNGSKVVIDLTHEWPEGFPGGTVVVNLNALDGAGGTWAFQVDGAAEGELSTAFDYGLAGVFSMFCKRFVDLPAGTEKIELTVTDVEELAAFDSWHFEAPEPPDPVIVPGQFTLTEYAEGETHEAGDADIEALEKLIKEACEEFGSHVKFVSLASMDKTENVQADKTHPTEAGHQEIYELMLAALEVEEEAPEEEEIVGAHMDFGFLRDSERRLIVAADGEGSMDQGFLRDDERAVLVTVEGDGGMDYGFIRDEDRRLVVVEGDIDHVDQGLPRDAEGRLVVTKGEAAGFSQGFLRDEDGRLVVVGL